MHSIDLDQAATTALDPQVREAMEPWLGEHFGNPSSRHRRGVAAAEAVDRARAQLAGVVGARSEDVIFTSGGTEADNLAVLGLARARSARGRKLVIGPTEHAAVRASAEALESEGFAIASARADAEGALDREHLTELLDAETVVVAQMLVSNEFGSVYPSAPLARLVRACAPNAALHVDAVQALGKLELSIGELDADSLALSAHKIHGPQGVGALVLAPGTSLRPLVFGGGQQGGRRPGTENVAGVVGFGRAAELAEQLRGRTLEHLRELRLRLATGLARIEGAHLLELGAQTMPGICTVLFEGVPAEVRLHHLDERGVAVSVGSACQAHDSDVSPSALAVGLDADAARRMLRFSFSRHTTAEEIDAALAALEAVEGELGSLGR
ncbi:MAG: cysteine desulfurase family protein [Planctomycetota bacterium]|jgi:cysteine desulfurase|nr:cysteine desulfurase family protein [Planctomycetota bacterium]